jgi:hypothetical protein
VPNPLACFERVCGTAPDGCGTNVTCGPSCPSGYACLNGACVCDPKSADPNSPIADCSK